MNIQELRAELDNDPEELGYAPFITEGNDGALMDLLNDKSLNGKVARSSFSVSEVQECIVASEFLALSDAKRMLWDMLTRSGSFDLANQNIVSQIEAVWEGTDTLSAIQDLYERDGSRAEALWGEGTVVSMQDIINAFFAERNPQE